MCLSRIYDTRRSDETLVMSEVAGLVSNNGRIEIKNLFGTEKILEGYMISEVDLMENYVILKSTGGDHDKP